MAFLRPTVAEVLTHYRSDILRKDICGHVRHTVWTTWIFRARKLSDRVDEKKRFRFSSLAKLERDFMRYSFSLIVVKTIYACGEFQIFPSNERINNNKSLHVLDRVRVSSIEILVKTIGEHINNVFINT